MSDDDQSVPEQAAEKANEEITLKRGELWLLRIAAATGVLSALSHGIELLHELNLL